MRLTVLVLAAGLLCPASGFSQEVTGFDSGNTLLEECTRGGGGVPSPYCSGYIHGASDAAQSTVRALGKKNGPFCLPRDASGSQIVDVVIKYLRDHPEERHYFAADEVTLALVAAFPCQ
jgi:hypothetical protein